MLAFIIAVLLTVPKDPTILSAPIVEAAQLDSQTIWLHKLEQCESGGNPNIKVLDTNGKYSYGILQFQMGTWLNYSALGATRENILDPQLQEKVALSILNNGGSDNWYICSRHAGAWPNKWPSDPM